MIQRFLCLEETKSRQAANLQFGSRIWCPLQGMSWNSSWEREILSTLWSYIPREQDLDWSFSIKSTYNVPHHTFSMPPVHVPFHHSVGSPSAFSFDACASTLGRRNPFSGTGGSMSISSNRLAYVFGFRGPSASGHRLSVEIGVGCIAAY